MKTSDSRILFAIIILLLISFKAFGQNIQLHYDFQRKCVTSTVEMFYPDKAGNTFFFIDMDFNPTMKNAYGEISREFCFWQDSKWNWLSLHVEYNGGLDGAYSFNNNWLGGLTYSGHSKDWSKTWSLSAMYKAIPGNSQVNSFQITGVWNLDFFDHWLSFNGFADFWREVNDDTEYTFISEPQLWVNLNKLKGMKDVNLSVGTEVEIAVNFAGSKGFDLRPTVAVKYAF